MRQLASRRPGRGFTLVELLVVILIITILMSLIIVLIANIIERARYAKTTATVKLLDEGCHTYRVDFNAWPPNDKGDSRSLHHYLGVERMLSVSRSESGLDIKTRKPPIIEFPPDILKDGGGASLPDPKQFPVPIVDAFDNLIRYRNPGQYNKKGVDIWSPGNDGKDQLDPTNSDFDDVTNWHKEY